MSTESFRRQWIRWIRASVLCSGSLAIAAAGAGAGDAIPLPPGVAAVAPVAQPAAQPAAAKLPVFVLPEELERESKRAAGSAGSGESAEVARRDEAPQAASEPTAASAVPKAAALETPLPGTRAHLLNLIQAAARAGQNPAVPNALPAEALAEKALPAEALPAGNVTAKTLVDSGAGLLPDDAAVAHQTVSPELALPSIVPAQAAARSESPTPSAIEVLDIADQSEPLLPVIVPRSGPSSEIPKPGSELNRSVPAAPNSLLQAVHSAEDASGDAARRVAPVGLITLPAPDFVSDLPGVPAFVEDDDEPPFQTSQTAELAASPEPSASPELAASALAAAAPRKSASPPVEVVDVVEIQAEPATLKAGPSRMIDRIETPSPQAAASEFSESKVAASAVAESEVGESKVAASNAAATKVADSKPFGLATESNPASAEIEPALPIDQVRKLLTRSQMEVVAGDLKTAHVFAEAAAEVPIPFELFNRNPQQVLAEVDFVTQRNHEVALATFAAAALPGLPEPTLSETVEPAATGQPSPATPDARGFRAIGSKSLNIRPKLASVAGSGVREKLTVPEQPARELAQKSPVTLHRVGTSRDWAAMSYSWEAPALQYNPLYFEDAQLERYGNDLGLVQPLASATQFYLTVPALPYLVGTEENGLFDCVYDLGYDRPGNCVPYQLYRPEFSWSGALIQAGFVTGLVFVLP